MERAHCAADRYEARRFCELRGCERDTGNEARYETAFGFQERDHVGCDTQGGRLLVRVALNAPVDAEKLTRLVDALLGKSG